MTMSYFVRLWLLHCSDSNIWQHGLFASALLASRLKILMIRSPAAYHLRPGEMMERDFMMSTAR